MSTPRTRRVIARLLPAFALIIVGLALGPLAGEEHAGVILLLAAIPALGQALVALVGEGLPPLVGAAAAPALACGVVALGPTMIAPGRAPLWVIGALAAALPQRLGVAGGLALASLLGASAALGLARADGSTAEIATAALVIVGVGLSRALHGAATTSIDDPAARIADLDERLREAEESARVLRRERGELERSVEDRLIALQAANRTLKGELQERRNAEEQALEASRIKSSFLANVSHELRTPLNAIIGYTEMLSEDADARLDEQTAKDQRSVLRAAQSLLKIIDDVLDLTKIEAGKLDINAEVFPVIELVENLGTVCVPLARRGGNTLKLKYGRELGYIRTDRAKLNRILLDLLSNACKFTQGGRIELRVDPEVVDERRYFVFSVSDTGIGIKPEVMERLFEPFRMADESSTREYGGLGLGLALARHYTEMLGGEINVESEVGKGTIFRVRLPVEPHDPRASGDILVSMY
ncbi:MAG: hypothetical protein H6711_33885 [Myxococcales bacterium]|nr:hypothetical protein [Myxococcales bacterium]